MILVYPSESRLLFLDGLGLKKETPVITHTTDYDALNGLPSWGAAINQVYTRFPGSKIRSVTPNSIKHNSRTVAFQQATGWHRLGRSSLKFTINGQLIIKDELEQSIVKRMLAFSYPLHTAKLGLWYKILITFVGIAFSMLCAFGLMSYFKKPAKS